MQNKYLDLNGLKTLADILNKTNDKIDEFDNIIATQEQKIDYLKFEIDFFKARFSRGLKMFEPVDHSEYPHIDPFIVSFPFEASNMIEGDFTIKVEFFNDIMGEFFNDPNVPCKTLLQFDNMVVSTGNSNLYTTIFYNGRYYLDFIIDKNNYEQIFGKNDSKIRISIYDNDQELLVSSPPYDIYYNSL